MGFVYKRDLSDWVRRVPEERKTNQLPDPKGFDVDKLTVNQIDQGNGTVIAKIPRIQGRIGKKQDSKDGMTYIQFITGRSYDPKTKQSRNTKTIIGTDFSWYLPGMMVINDKYYDYFDSDGRLYNDPMKKEAEKRKPEEAETEESGPEEAATDQPEPEDATGETETTEDPEAAKAVREDTAAEQPEPEDAAGESGAAETDREKAEPEEDERTEEEMTEELKQKEALLNLKLEEADRRNLELQKKYEEAEENLKLLENLIQIRIVTFEKAKKDHLGLLYEILCSYNTPIAKQAAKKPDAPMSLQQIRTINEILQNVREFLKGCETEDYLKLATEPEPEEGDGSEGRKGTTYGEMMLLLAPYISTLLRFKTGLLKWKSGGWMDQPLRESEGAD